MCEFRCWWNTNLMGKQIWEWSATLQLWKVSVENLLRTIAHLTKIKLRILRCAFATILFVLISDKNIEQVVDNAETITFNNVMPHVLSVLYSFFTEHVIYLFWIQPSQKNCRRLTKIKLVSLYWFDSSLINVKCIKKYRWNVSALLYRYRYQI